MKMMKIEKYTFGIGDRFAHQGEAQLRAIQAAAESGLKIHPVWNKSNREHAIIASKPADVRAEADAAVAALKWKGAYYVDADHIGLKTVDPFIPGSDFYTLDVADFTGRPADASDIRQFAASMEKWSGSISIPGLAAPLEITPESVRNSAANFLLAVQEAARIHRHVAERKGAENFVTEISIDETNQPQTPVELFLILAMIAQAEIPVQTIAPKFTGRFNKGVDYVGDLQRFEQEFDADLSVIAFAVQKFGLPETLKLSVHSGSDKFSLYPVINRQIKKHGVGLHVKTAGTTWLEEVIGLAESGGEGLAIAKEIYAGAHGRFEELTAPYATVIDISKERLPSPAEVAGWDSAQYVAALRHIPSSPAYNLHFRQLIHVGFKIAAHMGARYTDALEANAEIIARNVTGNLLERHIKPIFG
ncbi:MAG TPA: tagaturonate epimerase family protein [Chthoniobacteraceae bacterium]|jgi:hypothetical protein|nr:tagaturonate epimerase family protein [Chthoniobacteraceae bacterium]